jgi:hypothetical protein
MCRGPGVEEEDVAYRYWYRFCAGGGEKMKMAGKNRG